MSRLVRNASRYTKPHPHAVHHPLQPGSSIIELAGKPPPNETPEQKVARLRKAAQIARALQVSQYDTWLDKGRNIADAAHRIFVKVLFASSLLIVVVGVYAFVDLSLFKRRKNNEWREKWREEKAKEMAAAYDAVQLGTATEAQQTMVATQLAAESEAEERKNHTWTKRLFGISKEEKAGGSLGFSPSAPEASGQDGTGVIKAVEEALQDKAVRNGGGMLDQMADNAVQAAVKETKAWTSWWTRKS